MDSSKKTQLIYKSEYAEGSKEVLYTALITERSDELSKQCKRYVMIPHEQYRISDFVFEDPGSSLLDTPFLYYAFGLITNLFNTRMLPIDFDNIHLNKIIKLSYEFQKDPLIEAIDILESSRNGHHLILGFSKFINANTVLNHLPGCCPGYIHYANIRYETVIRTSQKFSNHLDLSFNIIKPVFLFRKINNIWKEVSYTTNSYTEKATNKRKNLNLRIKNEDSIM